MNVLILGGNGYIGSKVARKFVDEGYSVVCTRRANSDLIRLADVNGIRWISATIDSIENVMQHITFDYILNMACSYGSKDAIYNDVFNANVEFPFKVLNVAVKYGVKNFITIGTGLPDDFNMYSFSKKIFSEFGRFFVDKYGIIFNNLLLEMFYGEDEPSNRFLPSVILKMLEGKTVETTLGTQHRDIIYSKDVVQAIMIIMESNLQGYHEIPVGTGIAPTISEIIDYIWEETGRKSEIHKGSISMRANEPDCVAETAILKSLGDWEPINWKIGLRMMIDQMRRQLGGGNSQLRILFLVQYIVERRCAV